MPSAQTRITIFPAQSYEDAHGIIGRLAEAGFDPTVMFVDRAGQDYEVALHTSDAGSLRAKWAVYGGGYGRMLALVGAAAVLGAALGALWYENRSNGRSRSSLSRRAEAVP
jgi:hypothetical protein